MIRIKEDKPQKGAARSQKRPVKPEAAAPVVVRRPKAKAAPAPNSASLRACATCHRPFPMTAAERQRKHRAAVEAAIPRK